MEKTYNPALIQRTQRYMETHSIAYTRPPRVRPPKSKKKGA